MLMVCYPNPVLDNASSYPLYCSLLSASHKLTRPPGKLLKTVMQQLWNRQRKQDNRWLRAKVQAKNRSGVSIPVERELVQWFRAPSKREQEKPKLRPDLQLSTEAMQIWQTLKTERKAAMEAQGENFEAEDWWLERGDGKEGGKKAKAREEVSALMARLGVRGAVFVVENEEGNFVFVSPEGSVVGEAEEEEEDEGEKQGAVAVSQALALRGPKPAGP